VGLALYSALKGLEIVWDAMVTVPISAAIGRPSTFTVDPPTLWPDEADLPSLNLTSISD
jgi:hypothetical protein